MGDIVMKTGLIATALTVAMATSVQAQDGAYFGIGLGVSHNSTSATIVPDFDATATDFGLALTAGYRFASVGNLTYGFEGNLDIMGGKLMSDYVDACTDESPTWCEVDATLRLRGTVSSELASGARLMGSLGAAIVRGRAEDGPGNYVNATGRGLSLGVSWEQVGGNLPVRVDVNYDAIRIDDANNYDRKLDMIGLRVSYMF